MTVRHKMLGLFAALVCGVGLGVCSASANSPDTEKVVLRAERALNIAPDVSPAPDITATAALVSIIDARAATVSAGTEKEVTAVPLELAGLCTTANVNATRTTTIVTSLGDIADSKPIPVASTSFAQFNGHDASTANEKALAIPVALISTV